MDRYTRKTYQDMTAKASYFAWCARKRFPATGNDPVTGRSFHVGTLANETAREEGAEIHKLRARFWLRKARSLRLNK